MAGTAVLGRLIWQLGEVTGLVQETPRVGTLHLQMPDWPGHLAGQHVDVRLTADDGYQAQRSYSIASAPERMGELELTVERIEDGEVSPYLHDVLVPGDQLEVRGPIGGYFVWEVSLGGPLLLIAGGSGVVPLMAMLRHRAAQHATMPTRMLYSSRTADDVIYRDELDALAASDRTLEVFFTFTRQPPTGWTGYRRRIDAAMLGEVIKPFDKRARVYLCGPTLLVEAVANTLVQMELPTEQIRTERFGPSGA